MSARGMISVFGIQYEWTLMIIFVSSINFYEGTLCDLMYENYNTKFYPKKMINGTFGGGWICLENYLI